MSPNPLVDYRAGANAQDAQPIRRRRVYAKVALSVGWLSVLGIVFVLGYALAQNDAAEALVGVDALRAEVALLSEEVARARAERVRLDRAHQMDREAKRQAQASLAELQRERLRLSKRVAYLQRLLRDGEKGIIEVKELQLTRLDARRAYRFEMVLRQLGTQAGPIRGVARLRVVLSRDGVRQTLGLAALPGSSPQSVPLSFKHFQTISGELVLPDGAQVEQLIVAIEPEGEQLAASTEAFLWPPEARGISFRPLPVVARAQLGEATEVE